MKVLVAGGAGFIGSHLCRTLLEAGHQVVCLDDLSTGRLANVGDLAGHARFEFLQQDARSAPLVSAEAIFHLASPASPVDYERLQLETLAANSLGTWRLADIAVQTGAKLTYASTSEVYGDPLVHPQDEGYWGNVDPVGPRSMYDEGKRFGEALLTAMRRTRGLRATIVRIFNTYGPGMRPDDGRVIPELVTAALAGRPLVLHGDGSQTRSFCYVEDLVAGLLRVGLDLDSEGGIFNLGNPEEVTIRQLAEAIIEATGSTAPIVSAPAREGDPQQRRPDIGRVQRQYGWSPIVDLRTGLRRTVAAWPPTPGLRGSDFAVAHG
ncbi:MAG TPA: NAD-dependent epimerase/dehydratase family protein [Candidatus Limnocylindrales bacterium]